MNIDTKHTPRQDVNVPRFELSFGVLIHWLRLDEVVHRGWSTRLPCVLVASVLVLIILSGVGVPAKDVSSVLLLLLVSVPVTLVLFKVT